jgi:hypothetical protein
VGYFKYVYNDIGRYEGATDIFKVLKPRWVYYIYYFNIRLYCEVYWSVFTICLNCIRWTKVCTLYTKVSGWYNKTQESKGIQYIIYLRYKIRLGSPILHLAYKVLYKINKTKYEYHTFMYS